MSKRFAGNYSGLTLNTFAYAGGGLMMLPLTLWYSRTFDFSQVTWEGWACILYMAAFPSVLCYVIYYYALSFVSASRVSAFSYLQPFIATILAIPILGEHPTASLLSGGALVLVGVFVTERA